MMIQIVLNRRPDRFPQSVTLLPLGSELITGVDLMKRESRYYRLDLRVARVDPFLAVTRTKLADHSIDHGLCRLGRFIPLVAKLQVLLKLRPETVDDPDVEV